MLLKVCKFECDRSVIYVSLFEAPCTFRAVDMLWGIFLYIPTSHCTKFRYNRCMFGIDVSIIKRTVPEKHCTFSAVSRFKIEGCP